MELTTIARRNNPFRKLGGKVWRSKYLILMILPAIAFYIIFCYIPMYGILMAFQDFNPKMGIFGSEWVGFANFTKVFEEPKFWLAFRNTLIIGSIKIVISFTSAVIVALLINEIRMKIFKKTVQIIVTFPHFLSWGLSAFHYFSLESLGSHFLVPSLNLGFCAGIGVSSL